MTNLKTLKDIEKETTYQTINGKIIFDRLKQEAIKWVKYYRTKKYKIHSIIAYEFMNFFNLTEEDLQ